ncbi:MAG TPA: Ig-like domain-containing protein, partial [Pseudonocardiaceae bacterium]|nr:Ig-like domain-containing protein [Pseudonocardiaceae bacterium]
LGGFVIPFANVRPRASGTVQFKDGTTNLGNPVPIATGIAFGGFFVIPPGSHSLTAEFAPANPEAARPSTSNVLNFTF